jgi:hypothetical protein
MITIYQSSIAADSFAIHILITEISRTIKNNL